MSPQNQSLLGWFLLVVNLGYLAYALLTGRMEGLGDLFGMFGRSPNMPTTFARKPLAFLLGFAAHAALAWISWTMIRKARAQGG